MQKSIIYTIQKGNDIYLSFYENNKNYLLFEENMEILQLIKKVFKKNYIVF